MDGSYRNLIDITQYVDLSTETGQIDPLTYYTYYTIRDGERPDIVSYSLYNRPDYYWTFFILNDSLKQGLNFNWPLSDNSFEKMIASEYDKYSVITFAPAINDPIKGFTFTSPVDNSFSNVDLTDRFLPYLRISASGSMTNAKILKYDTKLLQLVCYDIRDANGNLADREKFISQMRYKLSWVNPYPATNPDDKTPAQIKATTEKYVANNILRDEWVNAQFDKLVQAVYDSGNIELYLDTIRRPDRYNVAFAPSYRTMNEHMKAMYERNNPNTTAAKTNYMQYSWASYRNAAYQYYSYDYFNEMTDESAYDILSNPAIVTPKYLSNYDNELTLNTNKSKIKIIRPEKIVEFSNRFFTILNNG